LLLEKRGRGSRVARSSSAGTAAVHAEKTL